LNLRAECGAHGAAAPAAWSSGPARAGIVLAVTHGQLLGQHLLRKLRARSSRLYRRWRSLDSPQAQPLFSIVRGGAESWERPRSERPAR
jgi:hypothetical protein